MTAFLLIAALLTVTPGADVERLSAALGAARVRRRLQALTGTALLGLGLKLALSERGR